MVTMTDAEPRVREDGLSLHYTTEALQHLRWARRALLGGCVVTALADARAAVSLLEQLGEDE